MRKGWASLALKVQEVLGHDPHSGNLFIFRGRRSDLIKVIWHDGQGMCLFAKRLERGRFIWPSPADGVVAISAGQMGYLLEASIGDCRRKPGDRQRLVDCGMMNQARFCARKAADFLRFGDK